MIKGQLNSVKKGLSQNEAALIHIWTGRATELKVMLNALSEGQNRTLSGCEKVRYEVSHGATGKIVLFSGVKKYGFVMLHFI